MLCWAKALPAAKRWSDYEVRFCKRRDFSVPISNAGAGSSCVGRDLHCKGCGVSDGDTVKVLTEQSCDTGKDCRSGKIQYRVRLAEIDTPEKKQPYGSKAKQALSDLVFGRMIKVEQIDKDRYGRPVANLYVDGKWVNAEMVRSGSAWVYRQYAKTPELFAGDRGQSR